MAIKHFIFIHALIFLSLCTCFALDLNLARKNESECIEIERQALLSFKHDLADPNDILLSWRSKGDSNCCNWIGVRCNNNKGHIISLDLHGPHKHNHKLEGKIGSSLANLSYLIHLDLSNNFFYQSSILENIGSLVNLQYLNLSYNQLKSPISPQLGNLSKLSTLDLQYNHFHGNFGWISNLPSLKHLYLSGGDFNSANDWTSVISKLTLLESLYLQNCNLPQPILPSHSFTNFSRFLSELDLNNNNLHSSFFSWLLNFNNNLTYLDIGYNNLQDLTLDHFENMSSLWFLNLCYTKVNFGSLNSFKNLCNLKTLSLSYNNLGRLLSDFFKIIPRCLLNSLQYLDLASNKFIGSLPNFTMFPSLRGLSLYDNMLNGTISQAFGQLFDLEHLYLDNNLLEGEVSEAFFSNLTNLRVLLLSGNSLTFNLKPNWIPPLQMDSIFVSSCHLGPLFPQWLQNINFSFLDISNNEIPDTIPNWFWNKLSYSNIKVLNLSHNKMKGEIPNHSIEVKSTPLIFLESNEFEGQIPQFLLPAVEYLSLADNKFSDLSCLCNITNSHLLVLDLSKNNFSGNLPDCWDSFSNLRFLYLSNNAFSGAIPRSIGNLHQLNNFYLRNNQFDGEFPLWSNFTNLKVLDVMNNKLSGTIPSWIGSNLPNLIRLTLKANRFHGNLPSSLCDLQSIQLLDISFNNITGSIPTCIENFNVFTQRSKSSESYYNWNYETGRKRWDLFYFSYIVTSDDDMLMVWKRKEAFILGKVLALGEGIDLSHNHLTGEIPDEITKLVGLITLNLSMNELIGRIPDKIGELHSLESLDLSRNHLFGPIPSSLSQISSLGVLDLSHNNLSGNIPTGTQLQSFPTSSYEGNFDLCGAPLEKCYEEVIQKVRVEDENEDKLIKKELFISISFGFITGFGGIFCSLILHKRWRHAYFKFLSNVIDMVKRSH